MLLQHLISQISPLDEQATQIARTRQDLLTKPPGSLGRLEELSIHVAGITGNPLHQVRDKVILIMAGDHGVVHEGVSAYPQEVTAQMVFNFLKGGAAINVLAKHIDARVVIVDMGVAFSFERYPNLISKKIGFGTGNVATGPAMTREQAEKSIITGAEIVLEQVENGMHILATGEMGIGNTTPSAAIASVFTGYPVAEITGRGTGVDDDGLHRKVRSIQNALQVNKPDPEDGLDVLSKIGGFEIGGLAGAVLACAANRLPVVIDGYVSTAAAMVAVSLAPQVRDYIIAAHTSRECGHQLMMEWLGVKPLLDMQMRLGEGTGAALAISIVEAACKLLCDMATFEQAGVSAKRMDER